MNEWKYQLNQVINAHIHSIVLMCVYMCVYEWFILFFSIPLINGNTTTLKTILQPMLNN